MPEPYKESFPAGSRVRIKPQADLERFARDWKYHNALTSEQLHFGGLVTTVKEVGFYHGGDPLYCLERAPGVWHEQCLEKA